MSTDLHQKVEFKNAIGVVALLVLVYLPPRVFVGEGPIFIFANHPKILLFIYTLIGGSIFGYCSASELKFVGLFSGMVATLIGTTIFTYFAFNPDFSGTILSIEIVLIYLAGGLLGLGLYYLVLKKYRNAKTT